MKPVWVYFLPVANGERSLKKREEKVIPCDDIRSHDPTVSDLISSVFDPQSGPSGNLFRGWNSWLFSSGRMEIEHVSFRSEIERVSFRSASHSGASHCCFGHSDSNFYNFLPPPLPLVSLLTFISPAVIP